MLADDALMLANVRAFSEPDPERAYRYKPFAYGPFGDPVDAVAKIPGGAAVRRRLPLLDAAGSVRRALAFARPAPAARLAPCC